ncbi:MAG: hypothetical protein A2X75_03890 [Gallionellales bacterium GWE2_58_10]|nr:MAG: hypothetical protein A2X75_03890 [Gallionellales bacterium GWE2_58_10]
MIDLLNHGFILRIKLFIAQMVCSINHLRKHDQPLMLMAGRATRMITIPATRWSHTTTQRNQQQYTHRFDKKLFQIALLNKKIA